jgi:hypothetical protein
MKALVDLFRCTFVSKRHLGKPCFYNSYQEHYTKQMVFILIRKGILLNNALLSHFQMQQNLQVGNVNFLL